MGIGPKTQGLIFQNPNEKPVAKAIRNFFGFALLRSVCNWFKELLPLSYLMKSDVK